MKQLPYAAGDPVQVLHSCTDRHGNGTAVATFPVEWCKPLARNGRYRIHITRCDGTPLEVEVDSRGRDVHGYVQPATKEPRP